MIKNVILISSLLSNLILLYPLVDQGITIAYMESSVSFLASRSHDLFLDVSDVYLCSDATKLSDSESNKVELNGVTLYIKDNIVIAIGLKGDPSPKLKCTR